MSLKSKIANLLPSYRTKNAIIDRLNNVMDAVDDLKKQVKNLDKKNEYLFYCLQHQIGENDQDTKKRVFKELPKASGDLRELQIVLSYILGKTKTICDARGIPYSLYGGTLLGAVRHNGFIPWDDDIDIAVFDDDFKTLENAINEDDELIMRRYYRYYENGRGGFITKIKLRRSETFFVDVFPWRSISIQSNEENKAWDETELMRERIQQEIGALMRAKGFVDSALHIPTAFPEIDHDVDRILDAAYKEFNDKFAPKAGCVGTHLCLGIELDWSFRRARKLRLTSELLPIQKDSVLFEGERYSAVNNYELALEKKYGDIWSLPKSIVRMHTDELDVSGLNEKSIIAECKEKHGGLK